MLPVHQIMVNIDNLPPLLLPLSHIPGGKYKLS